MSARALKCTYCGHVAPPGAAHCPECGDELLDRGVWYIRYASNIVGAVLGALVGLCLGVFALLAYLRCARYSVLGDHVGTVVLASALLGLLVGFFGWDRTRDAIDDAAAESGGKQHWWTC